MPASKWNRRNKKACSLRFERLESRQMMAAQIVGNPTVFATIQAAVNAALPNATITVDAGTYPEQVVINKTLTIKGAQAGVNARSLPRVYNQAAESIVTGTTNGVGAKTNGFYINADNVTIDGFVVQGQTSLGDTGAGVVIAPQRSGIKFRNNILQNNVSGMFIANFNAGNPLIIERNLFRNNNNVGENGGRGIYSHAGISGGNLVNVVIDNNAFIGNRGSTGTTGLEAAIALEAFQAGTQSDITITNNVFDTNGKAVLYFNVDNSLIENNYITNTLDQYSGILRFEGNVHDVTITKNTIYQNTGPAVAIDSKGVPGINSGFVVTQNNFYGNSLAYGSKISFISDDTVYPGVPDVRNNYWGSASGPGGDGTGTGDKVYSIGHPVTAQQWFFQTGGNAQFSPWSNALIGSGLMPYFGAAPTDGMNVQVEDFDHGGQGVAYSDAESTNQGGKTYRKWQGVDLETTTDTGAGYNIGYVKAGEWLKYSMFLPLGGTFTFSARVASAGVGGTFHFEVDGVNVTGPMSIPNTGGWQTWQTVTKTGVSVGAGAHVVRLVMDTNSATGSVGNFNWFRLTNTSPSMIPPAVPGNPVATPVDHGRVNLTWQDLSNDETGFIVERKVGAGSWQSLTTLPAGATSHSDLTVVGSTAYSYRVRSVGAGGQSAPSTEALATTPVGPSAVYLSDIPWVSSTNGWGPVERDLANGGDLLGDGMTLTLNGVTYAKGLGVHAGSEIVYNLSGHGYTQFLADVGVDDRQTTNGSIIFQVYLDGVLAFDSGEMGAGSSTQSINLALAGKSELKLVVTDAGDGNSFDHGDWANARFILPPSSSQPPAIPGNLLASPIGATLVNLSWNNVSGETGYIIERSLDGTTFTPLGTTLTDITTHSDTTASPNTQYWYRVRATNAFGNSDWSIVANVTTPVPPPLPAIPAGLVATAMKYNRIDLSWTDGANETSYKIERSLDGVTFTPLGTAAANATAYSDLTVSGSTQYWYRVIASNVTGDSDASAAATATTPVQPLPATIPTGLTATAMTPNRIDLSWLDASNETSYKIERSTNGTTFTLLATVAGDQITYSDLVALPNTQYWYRVRAANDAGDSDASVVANATTPMVPPAAPSGAGAVASTGTLLITLTWVDGSSNEAGFRIERSTDGLNFTQIGTTLANVTTYADNTVLAGQAYSYRVIAHNATGPSSPSNIVTATAANAPIAPSGLTAIAGGATAQVNLGWADNSNNETGFRIEKSLNGTTFTTLTTLGAGVTGYADGAVTAGQTYWYRVVALNAIGASAASNVASATVSSTPVGPGIVNTGDVGTTGVVGSMTNVSGTYTLRGGGADIYGSADAFRFAYRQITGNATIIARVSSLQNTDANAKAGIMFRESLAANSKHASVMVTPLNGIKALNRASTGGQTASATAASLKAPYWLKLVRSGSTFTSYRSVDGVTWTQISSQTVAMGSTIYVGLAVTSHKAGTLATATFDNVSVI